MDNVVKVNEFENPGKTPKRSSIISHIHNILSINVLKHYDEKTDAFVEFDAEECALAAILKAMVDYKTLTGEHTESMKAFLAWTYLNLDSSKLMDDYKKTPDKLKGL